MHAMGGIAAGWIVLAATLWALAVGGVAWGAVRLINRSPPTPVGLPSPLDILERRLAAGLITHAEFDDARARLREHELDL